MVKLVIFIMLIPCIRINAQGLVTDRPDQTESAVTVDLNSIQFETGFVYEAFKESGRNTEIFNIAGSLFRAGVAENLEVRLGINYIVINDVANQNGFTDFLTGIKYNFLDENSKPISLGLIFQSVLPFGNEKLNPEQSEPELILLVSKQLTGLTSIGVNLGIFKESTEKQVGYLYTMALGFSFSDKFACFFEFYGNFRRAVHPDHFFDTGLTYLLNDDIQLDISAGNKISAAGSYWFISSGISFRLINFW